MKGDNNRSTTYFITTETSLLSMETSRFACHHSWESYYEIYPNFQSIEHHFDYYIPPVYVSLDDQIEPIATKIGRVPSQLPCLRRNPFFRFESINKKRALQKFPSKSTLLTPYKKIFNTLHIYVSRIFLYILIQIL